MKLFFFEKSRAACRHAIELLLYWNHRLYDGQQGRTGVRAAPAEARLMPSMQTSICEDASGAVVLIVGGFDAQRR